MPATKYESLLLFSALIYCKKINVTKFKFTWEKMKIIWLLITAALTILTDLSKADVPYPPIKKIVPFSDGYMFSAKITSL